MKKTILLIVLCRLITPAMAQEIVVAANKEKALASCEEKAKASPEELKKDMLVSCRCVVEHTDFEKANQLNNSGDTNALHQLYEAATKACEKK